eukprot:1332766-Rhodomonas_salina.1
MKAEAATQQALAQAAIQKVRARKDGLVGWLQATAEAEIAKMKAEMAELKASAEGGAAGGKAKKRGVKRSSSAPTLGEDKGSGGQKSAGCAIL